MKKSMVENGEKVLLRKKWAKPFRALRRFQEHGSWMWAGLLVFLSLVFWAVVAGESSVFAQSIDAAQAEKESVLPPGIDTEEFRARAVQDQRVRRYLLPKRVVWKSESGILNEELLLEKPLGQTSTSEMASGFNMHKVSAEEPCGILLDFGAEIQGGIRLEARDLVTGIGSVGKTVRVRVRFGESADEAMAEMGEKGACNEHSVRDMVVSVPWLGAIEFGESAFRFVRLDLIDTDSAVFLDSVRAVFTYRDLPWLGSFSCSDERLNSIWKTAAHTLHLTLHSYIFEGAKRDRLVWYGDFHPQMMSMLYVFGTPQVLKDTLGKYARETWPLPKWMNTMPNYSLWWLISIGDYYRFSGDLAFLQENHEYISGLVDQLEQCVQENGCAGFDSPFLDWPTSENRPALDAGTHAMFCIVFDQVASYAGVLNDQELEQKALALSQKVRTYVPQHADNKQAAALMTLAGVENSENPNIPVVLRNGGENFSTFYGYYMLEALAKAGEQQAALNVIREYWGAMLDVGATTFWEDFDLKWLDGSGRIDEITPPGLKSLHGDHGNYCYLGFRHSLCHGWATGPAAWLSAHVLGVQPVDPGFQTVRIEPFLGDLDWAEGSVPTPRGELFVRHEKQADGSIQTTVRAPDGVNVLSASQD